MTKDRAPSSLVASIVEQLEGLKEKRGLTFEEIEHRGGMGQATWYKWAHGSPPKIDSLENTARALDAELMVLVVEARDKRTARATHVGVSPEVVEIAAVVDQLEESVRVRILHAVHRLAQTLRPYPDDCPP